MYKVYLDGQLLYDPRNTDYSLISLTAEFEINKTNSLEFKIAPTHPMYDKIYKLKSKVEVYQDENFIHEFRVLNIDTDFNNIKTVSCEGELSYLLDSVQSGGTFEGVTFKRYLQRLIDNHNNQVEPEKEFVVGTVTVTNSKNKLYLENEYASTLETINNTLVESYGGFLRTRHKNNNRYIDYVNELDTNDQVISFGKNLLDLDKEIRGEDIVTVLIPLGATNEKTEERLTIESVNNGKYYIEDTQAINLYGRIVKIVEFDDITDPHELLEKAREELNFLKYPTTILTLTAVDLHLIDVNIERIKTGDLIRVVSAPHGIDEYMRVTNLDIDFLDPSTSKITLGANKKTFAEEMNSSFNQSFNKLYEDTNIIQSKVNNRFANIEDNLKEYVESTNDISNRVDSVQTSVTNLDNNKVTINQTYGNAGTSFVLDRDGLLTCNNAVIDGRVTANSGLIAGFYVGTFDGKTGADTIRYLASDSSNAPNILISAKGTKNQITEYNSVGYFPMADPNTHDGFLLLVGNVQDDNGNSTLGYRFAVRNDGTLYANNSVIKGDIVANTLTLGNGVSIQSSKIDGINNYAKTTDVNSAINSSVNNAKNELNSTIRSTVNDAKTELNTKISNKANQSELIATNTNVSNINAAVRTLQEHDATQTNRVTAIQTTVTNLDNNSVLVEQTYGTEGVKSFTLSRDGLLTCENAVVKGQIIASSGSVGGFDIQNNALVGDNLQIYPKTFGSTSYARMELKGHEKISMGSLTLNNAPLIITHTSNNQDVTDFNVSTFGAVSNLPTMVNNTLDVSKGVTADAYNFKDSDNKLHGQINLEPFSSSNDSGVITLNKNTNNTALFDPENTSLNDNMIISAPTNRYLKLVSRASESNVSTVKTSLEVAPKGGGKLNGTWKAETLEIGELKIGNNTYSVTRDSNGFLKAT